MVPNIIGRVILTLRYYLELFTNLNRHDFLACIERIHQENWMDTDDSCLSGEGGNILSSPSVSPIRFYDCASTSTYAERAQHGGECSRTASSLSTPTRHRAAFVVEAGHENWMDTDDSCLSGEGGNISSPSVSPIRFHDCASTSTYAERAQHGGECSRTASSLSTPTRHRAAFVVEAGHVKKEIARIDGRVKSAAQKEMSHHSQLLEDTSNPESAWNLSCMVRMNVAEPVVPPAQAEVQPLPDNNNWFQLLSTLLKEVGLDKYYELFENNELDISTFTSLDEADLIEIGVTALGARKKILLVIAELKAREVLPDYLTVSITRWLDGLLSSQSPSPQLADIPVEDI